MLKKVLAVVLAAAMIFGLVSVAFAASPFPDTAGVEQEAAIAKLKALGIVKGDDKGYFRPYDTINRAEFTAMVVRMLGFETAASYLNTPTVFPDVTSQWAWAYGYINVATGQGLVKGFDDGTFRPGEPVTQAQAVTILLRALGYNDNLPGEWPADYVMQAAQLEMISSGFGGQVAATRAFVAELVNEALAQVPVKEDPDVAGEFDEIYTDGTTLYEKVFGLKKEDQEPTVSGKVVDYDTDDRVITILVDGTEHDYYYVSGVTIYGVDTVADLEGNYVEATFNKDGDIVFVNVTTEVQVVGTISDVDTVDGTITIGGHTYDVASDAEVLKNGAELEGTLASKLSEIVDADAKVFIEDDVVYRIVASILDKEGLLDEKITEIKSGDVLYKFTLTDDGNNEYTLSDDVTIVRNGAAASWSDLKSGDSIKFAIGDDNEVVYIDAYSQVLEGYTLVQLKATSEGTVATFEIGNKQVTYTINEDDYDDEGVPVADLEPGTDYDITLDRDGEIICLVEHEAEDVTTGAEVRTVEAKYTTGTSSDTEYKLELDDGTVLILNDVKNGTDVRVNGNAVSTTSWTDADAKKLWNETSVGMLVVADADAGSPYMYFYSPSVTGEVYKSGNTYVIVPDDTDLQAFAFVTNWSTDFTVNGTSVSSSAYDIPDVATDNFTATVKFAGGAKSGEPLAAEVDIENFATSGSYVDLPVVSVKVSGGEYRFTVMDEAGQTHDVPVSSDEVIVVRDDGHEVKTVDPSAISIGDRLYYSPGLVIEGDTTKAYIKAVVDDDDPELTAVKWTWDEDKKEMTLTFDPDEAIMTTYVWIGSTEYELDTLEEDVTPSASGWTWTSPKLESQPSKVSVQVVDFAGNQSSVVLAEKQ